MPTMFHLGINASNRVHNESTDNNISHPKVNSVTISSASTNNEIEHLVKWSYFSCHKLQLGKT